eukprot:1140082-Pelagomonas_calceolata.AAC.4
MPPSWSYRALALAASFNVGYHFNSLAVAESYQCCYIPGSSLQQAANVATYHKQGAPSAAQPNIAIWQGVGYEALVSAQQAYTSTVVASYKVGTSAVEGVPYESKPVLLCCSLGSAAVLSRHDYTAIKSMLQSTSFESLKASCLHQNATQAESVNALAYGQQCDGPGHEAGKQCTFRYLGHQPDAKGKAGAYPARVERFGCSTAINHTWMYACFGYEQPTF